MNSITSGVILLASIICLIGSLFLLPSLKVSKGSLHLEQPSASSDLAYDTLALPTLNGAKFERKALSRDVQPGDLLGLIIKRKNGVASSALAEIISNKKFPEDLSTIPIILKQQLDSIGIFAEMLKPEIQIETSGSQTKIQTKTGAYLLKGVERDFLEAEIMGAEGAVAEIEGKISHLEDAGKTKTKDYKKLKAALSKNEKFIEQSKEKLAAREESIVETKPDSSSADFEIAETSGEPESGSLSQSQLLQLESIYSRIPLDTQRVFAPIAGRYYRPDDGVGFIISQGDLNNNSKMSQNKGQSSYVLMSTGQPVLWGLANRLDTVQGSSLNDSTRLDRLHVQAY